MSGCAFFFQAGVGIRVAHWCLEFRRVLFRSDPASHDRGAGATAAGQRLTGPALVDPQTRMRRVNDLQDTDIDAFRERRKIGRASRRERVCQYVELSVVAVSTTKKTTTAYCYGTRGDSCDEYMTYLDTNR